MGVSTPTNRKVELNNWTLVFSDPQLEQDFRNHQSRVWGSTELWRLKMNLLAGLINLSITSYLLSSGNIFTQQGLQIMYRWGAPYMTVAIIHYCLGRRWHDTRTCSLVNHVGEVVYSVICTLSMPTWVLRYEGCLELKVFVRQLILGSGILIGMWLRFLTPAFFPVACLLTSLQFAFQAAHLTQPTCNALMDSEFSKSALQQLLHSLNRISNWALHGTATASADSITDLAGGCYSMMYVLQMIAGGTLLYTTYRMERANRGAFLQGKARLVAGWPRVPALVQAVLHAVVFLQAFAMVWALLRGVNDGFALAGNSRELLGSAPLSP